MSNTRTDYAGIAAQASPFNARERQRLIEPIMAFYESVNELRDDQKLHLVTLYEYHQTLDALAAAEQRATESDARAERWRVLVVDVAKYLADSEESDAYPLYERLWANLAAPAPATQPDERAAKERAVIDAARPVLGMLRGTHSAFNQVIYSQALGDALSALDALDATDGAAKEGGRSIGDDGRVNSSSH